MKKLAILLFSISSVMASAQSIQPSMMVVPHTSRGELALEIYEGDEKYRAIIAGIEKAIIDRGGSLQALQPIIQKAREDMLRSRRSSTDIVDLMNTKNEITVAAEITYRSNGPRITVEIRLKALEALTGAVVYSGPLFMLPPLTDSADLQSITAKALTDPNPINGAYIDGFLSGMQSAFTKMIKYGQEFTVIIITDDNSTYLLNNKANDEDKLISEKIDEWAASKAVNGNFRYVEISEKYLKRADIMSNLTSKPKMMKIRVPYRTDDDKPYTINRFARELRKAILKICHQSRIDTDYKPDGKSTHVHIDKEVIMITMPAFK